MLQPCLVIWMLSVGLMVLGAGQVSAQDFPNKSIRIVTSAAGGSGDYLARLIAQGISGPLGQPVIVDNRSSGVIPGEIVARAAPDGYTLLVFGSVLWVGPLLQKAPYDPVRDFSPVTLMVRSPNVLVVHPSVPVKSVKELIALAKARPGDLNYAASGIGGSTHLAAELFNSMAGVKIVRISYNGAGPALNDLLAGHVQLTFEGFNVVPHIKLGKLRALGVTTVQPTALFPGLPPVSASGLPGYEAVAFFGIFAAAKTPESIINRLNQETVRFLLAPEMKERFSNIGLEPVASSPEEFAAKIKSEVAKWSKVIKDAGIKIE